MPSAHFRAERARRQHSKLAAILWPPPEKLGARMAPELLLASPQRSRQFSCSFECARRAASDRTPPTTGRRHLLFAPSKRRQSGQRQCSFVCVRACVLV